MGGGGVFPPSLQPTTVSIRKEKQRNTNLDIILSGFFISCGKISIKIQNPFDTKVYFCKQKE